MSLKKGVFIILLCAAYAYVVFWYGFAIYGAIGERCSLSRSRRPALLRDRR
jgi:hypothetical protein